jgi:hypothetical protein
VNLGRGSRGAVISLVVVGIVGYLIVVDLGVNAGQVHYGVTVAHDFSVGGLTEEEAVAALERRMALLGSRAIHFGAKGINVYVHPIDDLGWRPRPEATARLAMRVGRDGAPLGALLDRGRAWLGAVQVDWQGGARPGKVSRLINRVERRVDEAGFALDRARFRGKIKRLVVRWPRAGWYRLPLSSEG